MRPFCFLSFIFISNNFFIISINKVFGKIKSAVYWFVQDFITISLVKLMVPFLFMRMVFAPLKPLNGYIGLNVLRRSSVIRDRVDDLISGPAGIILFQDSPSLFEDKTDI